MGLIQDLRPINHRQEKEKFFSSDSYQPQFDYVKSFSAAELNRWGYPKANFVEFALNRVNEFGISPTPEKSHLLNEEAIVFEIKKVLKKFGLDTSNFLIDFSSNLVSRCLIKQDKIVFRKPIDITEEKLKMLINHEFYTHMTRRINGQQLGIKSSDSATALRTTEEGLASLNGYLVSQDKKMTGYCMNYLAISLSLEKSFREVFDHLIELGLNETKAWNITLRTKRGIKNTAEPGAFTKGITYLEGIVEVYNWILDESNDIRKLYIGKLSLNDFKTIDLNSIDLDKVKLPKFTQNQKEYRREIKEIGKVNKLNEL